MKKTIFLLFLTSCSTMQNYQPKLMTPPKDQFKYDSDLAECRSIASDKEAAAAREHNANGGQIFSGLFGIAGAALSSASDSNPDTWKLPATLINECLVTKGYQPQ